MTSPARKSEQQSREDRQSERNCERQGIDPKIIEVRVTFGVRRVKAQQQVAGPKRQ
jgi:hypothetical protein